jgi:hypothetical protein
MTPLKLPAWLRADCSRCTGLCCVAPPFYAVQGFGYDKPAHTACTYLTANDRCAIHARRAAAGFEACTTFDCYGAGQRVTQWSSSTADRTRVFSAYSSCLVLHRLIAALTLAEATVLRADRARLRLKRIQLNHLSRTGLETLKADEVSRLECETLALLRGLLRNPGGRQTNPD